MKLPQDPVDALMSQTIATPSGSQAGPSLPFRPASVPPPSVVAAPPYTHRPIEPIPRPAPASVASPSVVASPSYERRQIEPLPRLAPASTTDDQMMNAARLGAVEASHAAADPRPSGPPSLARSTMSSEPIELLWMDPEGATAACADLERRRTAPPDAGSTGWLRASEATPGDPSAMDVHRALAIADESTVESLYATYRAALERRSGDRAFVSVAGTLVPHLDERARLRICLAFAQASPPPDDKRVHSALEAGTRALSSADVPDELVHLARTRVGEAIRPSHRDLDAMVERAAIQSRALSFRDLFGARYALATVITNAARIPVYLPQDAAAQLPLLRAFPARVLGELRARQEEDATAPIALKIVALGRSATTS